MLKRRTLFVIGAGAGADVAMPLGDELRDDIASKLNFHAPEFNPHRGSHTIDHALTMLAQVGNEDYERYKSAAIRVTGGIVHAKSIDAYLHRHADDKEAQVCGKMAIVEAILQWENSCDLFVDPSVSPLKFRRPDKVHASWFEELWFLLQDGLTPHTRESIFEKLYIVNFNYDRCVEHFFYGTLQEAFHMPPADAASLIQATLKISHPYGAIDQLPWQQGGTEFGEKATAQRLLGLWSRIVTFNEEFQDKQKLKGIGNYVANAERIVFLGSHFWEQNLSLLRPPPETQGNQVDVFATALGRSKEDVRIITCKLSDMVRPRGAARLDIEPNMDCKALFGHYGLLFGT